VLVQVLLVRIGRERRLRENLTCVERRHGRQLFEGFDVDIGMPWLGLVAFLAGDELANCAPGESLQRPYIWKHFLFRIVKLSEESCVWGGQCRAIILGLLQRVDRGRGYKLQW
jgi:hypothetical protein